MIRPVPASLALCLLFLADGYAPAAQPPASADAGAPAASQAASLGDIFSSDPNLSTWLSMSVQGNYFNEMTGSGLYTVFVPVNSAFNKVPASLVLQDLKGQGSMSMPNITRLRSVVRYQVVRGTVPPEALRDGAVLTTMSGQKITVRGSGANATLTMRMPRVGSTNLGGTSVAHVVGQPLPATNGIVYMADTLFAR